MRGHGPAIAAGHRAGQGAGSGTQRVIQARVHQGSQGIGWLFHADAAQGALEAVQGAIDRALKGKCGFHKNYAKYTAGNLTPGANFPEGAEYPGGRIFGSKVLTKRKRSKRFAKRIHHLASASYAFGPDAGLDARKWKLSLRISGPAKRTSPAAVVVVHLLNGKRQVKIVKLNRRGDGRKKVSFDSRKVGAVSVTLVNGSTRYKCDRDTVLACGGKPRDDKGRFAVKARVTK